MDGALDTVLARPVHHLLGFVSGLDGTQPHFTQQRDTGIGQVLEVLFDHAFFDDRGARNDLHAAGAEIVERTLRRDGQGLQSHNVFGTAGQVHLAR
ncbi:hypothetical protein D3C71_1896630 [compost metagenome]